MLGWNRGTGDHFGIEDPSTRNDKSGEPKALEVAAELTVGFGDTGPPPIVMLRTSSCGSNLTSGLKRIDIGTERL